MTILTGEVSKSTSAETGNTLPRSCLAATEEERKLREQLDAEAGVIKALVAALRELHDFAERSTHHRYEERSRLAFERAAELLSQPIVAVLDSPTAERDVEPTGG